MKSEDQILELLAQLLRKQDQTQERLQQLTQEVVGVKQEVVGLKQEVQTVNARLGGIEENQQAHLQILRTLAVNQRKHQRELEGITDILDSVARMQRNQNRRLDRLENPADFV